MDGLDAVWLRDGRTAWTFDYFGFTRFTRVRLDCCGHKRVIRSTSLPRNQRSDRHGSWTRV